MTPLQQSSSRGGEGGRLPPPSPLVFTPASRFSRTWPQPGGGPVERRARCCCALCALCAPPPLARAIAVARSWCPPPLSLLCSPSLRLPSSSASLPPPLHLPLHLELELHSQQNKTGVFPRSFAPHPVPLSAASACPNRGPTPPSPRFCTSPTYNTHTHILQHLPKPHRAWFSRRPLSFCAPLLFFARVSSFALFLCVCTPPQHLRPITAPSQPHPSHRAALRPVVAPLLSAPPHASFWPNPPGLFPPCSSWPPFLKTSPTQKKAPPPGTNPPAPPPLYHTHTHNPPLPSSPHPHHTLLRGELRRPPLPFAPPHPFLCGTVWLFFLLFSSSPAIPLLLRTCCFLADAPEKAPCRPLFSPSPCPPPSRSSILLVLVVLILFSTLRPPPFRLPSSPSSLLCLNNADDAPFASTLPLSLSLSAFAFPFSTVSPSLPSGLPFSFLPPLLPTPQGSPPFSSSLARRARGTRAGGGLAVSRQPSDSTRRKSAAPSFRRPSSQPIKAPVPRPLDLL